MIAEWREQGVTLRISSVMYLIQKSSVSVFILRIKILSYRFKFIINHLYHFLAGFLTTGGSYAPPLLIISICSSLKEAYRMDGIIIAGYPLAIDFFGRGGGGRLALGPTNFIMGVYANDLLITRTIFILLLVIIYNITMYYSSKPKRQSLNEGNGAYPDATIRQYLNVKRITQDKTCLIIFILYGIALTIMMGIGFFFGNYGSLGITVNDAAPLASRQQCPFYVSQDFLTCLNGCSETQVLFLQKVCVGSSYNPSFSSEVDGLISMYNLKYTLPIITYTSAGLLVFTGILFCLIVYFPKIIYAYITVLFLMLLSLSFYLLKNVELRLTSNNIVNPSIFYTNEENIRYLSFLLLGIYLLIFPFILFSPKKIQLAAKIIGGLKEYFSAMFSMNLFTFLVVLVTWGSLIVEIFLVIHFYTAGTVSETPTQSMFYTYTGMQLYNPASLTFHFIGIYWLFGTVISWHKYFTSTAICLWYFQQSQYIYPVKRGLKRSLRHVGSAAVDAILMPMEWLLLLCYSITKINPEEGKEDEEEETNCCTNCVLSFRKFINKCYRNINRNSPSSGVLTNFGFFDSCEMSTSIFAQNNHRFFNIGGTVTIFLTLFVCMLWVMITYFILYFEVYNKSYPPPISSMILPMFAVFIIGLVVGSLFANLYTAAIDCLLFCYLMERKNMIEGEQPRAQHQLRIKQTLDTCYYRTEEQKKGQSLYVYEEMDEHTLDLTYVTRKQ